GGAGLPPRRPGAAIRRRPGRGDGGAAGRRPRLAARGRDPEPPDPGPAGPGRGPGAGVRGPRGPDHAPPEGPVRLGRRGHGRLDFRGGSTAHLIETLLPRPKRARSRPGVLRLRPGSVVLVAADEEPPVRALARELAARIGGRAVERFNPALEPGAMRLALAGDDRLGRVRWTPPAGAAEPRDAYRITVTSRGALLVGGGEPGLRHAVTTFLQLRHGAVVAAAEITDWPSLAHRAVMEDVSRHKVPTLAELKAFADRLAGWKINALQLYLENVFTFKSHPGIGRGYARITPAEIRELDAHCRAR